MYDLVIRNGKIVDGSGQPSFLGDIAIQGDRIVKIGLVEESGSKEIDAEGNLVKQFIDGGETAGFTYEQSVRPFIDDFLKK